LPTTAFQARDTDEVVMEVTLSAWQVDGEVKATKLLLASLIPYVFSAATVMLYAVPGSSPVAVQLFGQPA
jgi:hypothetical protein